MSDPWKQALESATEQVLSTMFFSDVVAVRTAAGQEQLGEEALAIMVAFYGSPSGRYHVWIEPRAARELSAAFLGVDAAELNIDRVAAAMCEMANMICGAFVSAIEGSTLIRLDAPVFGSAAAAGADAPRQRFLLDAGIMEARVDMEGEL
jgi:hypothetical protein